MSVDRKELEIKRSLVFRYAEWKYRSCAILCGRGVKAKVNIPDDVSTAYIVFTKRPTSQNWEIKHTILRMNWGFGRTTNEDCYRLIGFGGALMSKAEETIDRLYKQGYRYVHIEYEQ